MHTGIARLNVSVRKLSRAGRVLAQVTTATVTPDDSQVAKLIVCGSG